MICFDYSDWYNAVESANFRALGATQCTECTFYSNFSDLCDRADRSRHISELDYVWNYRDFHVDSDRWTGIYDDRCLYLYYPEEEDRLKTA